MTHKDLFGIEIKPGDFLLRPVVRGDSPQFGFARVVSVGKRVRIRSFSYCSLAKEAPIQYTDRCVVISREKVPEKALKAFDEAWAEDGPTGSWTPGYYE